MLGTGLTNFKMVSHDRKTIPIQFIIAGHIKNKDIKNFLMKLASTHLTQHVQGKTSCITQTTRPSTHKFVHCIGDHRQIPLHLRVLLNTREATEVEIFPFMSDYLSPGLFTNGRYLLGLSNSIQVWNCLPLNEKGKNWLEGCVAQHLKCSLSPVAFPYHKKFFNGDLGAG